MANVDETRVLTEKERIFLNSYLSGEAAGNASAAARRAFDVSDESAASYGSKVLARPHIKAAIARFQAAEAIPMQQFWLELKKVIEQDKSMQAKVAGLRLKAEIDGLTHNKETKSRVAIPDQSVLDELAERIAKYGDEGSHGRTET